jgi:hypothetical protein
LSHLRKSVQYGLDKTKALEALTTRPAQLLNRKDLGHLKPGAMANFLVTSGDIFEEDSDIFENWVQGTNNILKDKDIVDIRGNYTLKFEDQSWKLNISGAIEKPAAKLTQDSTNLKAKLTYKQGWMYMTITNEAGDGKFRLSALASKNGPIEGTIVKEDGAEALFTATKTSAFESKKEAAITSAPAVMPVTFPNVGYGYKNRPTAENTLFKNATVWTSEDAGILDNTDVLVRNGKIVKIGKDLCCRKCQNHRCNRKAPYRWYYR